MLKNFAIAAALTVAVGGAALAQNEAPPDNAGKTNVPTGAATTGRSTYVAPVTAPATAPVEPTVTGPAAGAAETGGVKAGVGSTLNKSQ